MEEKKEKRSVPYIVYEGTMSRFERVITKLWVLIIILIILLVATNIAWISYENSFEDVVTYTQDADVDTSNGNAYINNGGDMNYGKGESETIDN